MKEKLLEYLEKNSIKGDIKKDVVSFNTKGLNFVCQFFPEDPCFFRLMLPRIDKKDTAGLRDVIAEINSHYKVAKIIEVEDEPWLVAESFAYSKDNGEVLIARLVLLLAEAYNRYREIMLKKVDVDRGQQ